jgi:hypothetical protein
VRSLLPLLLVAILTAGCGNARVESKPSEPDQTRGCEVGPPGFRRCGVPTSAEDGGLPARSSIERLRDDGTWQEIAGHVGTHVPVPGGWVGHWESLALSPDRETILALWSAECEVPTAYFVAVAGGNVRPVTGERDLSKSPESSPIGWAKDGRARVRLLTSACGIGAHRPGVYLIDPETGIATFVRRLRQCRGRMKLAVFNRRC